MPDPLSAILDRSELRAVTVCKSGAEFQASFEVTRGTFRVRTAPTPSEALRDVLMIGQPLPPPPY